MEKSELFMRLFNEPAIGRALEVVPPVYWELVIQIGMVAYYEGHADANRERLRQLNEQGGGAM